MNSGSSGASRCRLFQFLHRLLRLLVRGQGLGQQAARLEVGGVPARQARQERDGIGRPPQLEVDERQGQDRLPLLDG